MNLQLFVNQCCLGSCPNTGVEPKIGGKPPKRMVFFMENPMKMDDLGGKNPLFLVQHPYHH